MKEQYIKWLLEGRDAWNARRLEDGELAEIDVDLAGVDIRGYFENHLGLPRDMTPTPLAQYELVGANFTGADLWNSDFSEAELLAANLTSANLIHANFTDAKLEEADITQAQLWHANLTDADLRRAKLTNADLRDANFTRTNLLGADLTNADLSGTELWKAVLYPDFQDILPIPQQCDTVPGAIDSVGELLTTIKALREFYENTSTPVAFYFRGERKNNWQLRPSIMRDSNPTGVERLMLTDLISQRPEDFGDLRSAITQWVLAQHHGLKTRFLDITSNPLVGLFHAREHVVNTAGTPVDGRLHIFAIPPWLILPFNSDTISVIANFAKLSKNDQLALLGKETSYWGHETSYSKAMRELCQLIQVEKPYFVPRIDPRDFYRVYVVEPQRSSERIRAQSGAFLASAAHERFERDEILEWNDRIPIYAHYMLDIPNDSKTEIGKELELLNITPQTLFPGLDSSAAAITAYYQRRQSEGEKVQQDNTE